LFIEISKERVDVERSDEDAILIIVEEGMEENLRGNNVFVTSFG
jgi:hypothetical protein